MSNDNGNKLSLHNSTKDMLTQTPHEQWLILWRIYPHDHSTWQIIIMLSLNRKKKSKEKKSYEKTYRDEI